MLKYYDAIVHRWKFTVGIIRCIYQFQGSQGKIRPRSLFGDLSLVGKDGICTGRKFQSNLLAWCGSHVASPSLERHEVFIKRLYVWLKMHTNFWLDNLRLDITLTWLSILVLMTITGFMDGDHVIWSKSIRRIRIPDSKLLFDLHVFALSE